MLVPVELYRIVLFFSMTLCTCGNLSVLHPQQPQKRNRYISFMGHTDKFSNGRNIIFIDLSYSRYPTPAMRAGPDVHSTLVHVLFTSAIMWGRVHVMGKNVSHACRSSRLSLNKISCNWSGIDRTSSRRYLAHAINACSPFCAFTRHATRSLYVNRNHDGRFRQ